MRTLVFASARRLGLRLRVGFTPDAFLLGVFLPRGGASVLFIHLTCFVIIIEEV